MQGFPELAPSGPQQPLRRPVGHTPFFLCPFFFAFFFVTCFSSLTGREDADVFTFSGSRQWRSSRMPHFNASTFPLDFLFPQMKAVLYDLKRESFQRETELQKKDEMCSSLPPYTDRFSDSLWKATVKFCDKRPFFDMVKSSSPRRNEKQFSPSRIRKCSNARGTVKCSVVR